MLETKNAKITSTFLGKEDHGIPTCNIQLDYGSAAQGFGGYDMRWWGFDFIQSVLDTLEVESWERLPGTYCRVKADYSHVESIGHITKDQWFTPSEAAEERKKEKGE